MKDIIICLDRDGRIEYTVIYEDKDVKEHSIWKMFDKKVVVSEDFIERYKALEKANYEMQTELENMFHDKK